MMHMLETKTDIRGYGAIVCGLQWSEGGVVSDDDGFAV